MGGHVVLRARAISRPRDDRAVQHQHRADRHFAPRAGRPCFLERDLHEAICHARHEFLLTPDA